VKFLCDQCKAKYQIDDQKVVGKTVRMKCRKCGHMIEVRAAVTESSTSAPPPADPKRPGAGLATSLAKAPPHRPPSARPTALSSAPPGALAQSFQRNVSDAPQARSSFPPDAGDGERLSSNDEWYVAINGVPVGPIRIAELRRKAATGAINDSSLAWREGLEEWRPIRTITELATVLREAAANERPSLTPPPAAPKPGKPPVPSRPPARPGAPTAPRPATAPQARHNVVPLHGRGAAAEKLDVAALAPLLTERQTPAPPQLFGPAPDLGPSIAPPTPAPTSVAPDPFAIVEPVPASRGGDPFRSVPPPASLGAQAIASLPPPSAVPSVYPVTPQRKGIPLWFWPILVFSGVFGIAAAVMLFSRPAPAPQPLAQATASAPTAGETAPAATATTTAVDTTSADAGVSTAGTKVASASGSKGSGGAVAAAAPAAAEAPKRTATDISGLLGGGPGGPAPAAGGGGGGGGGGGLDQGAVERVVAAKRAGVKRTCWDRNNADKSSAKITVAITVAGNGSVSNASSTGDDAMIGKCIEQQVRTWTFPPSGGTTTVNVPFVFVRQ